MGKTHDREDHDWDENLVATQKGKDMDRENCRVGRYSMWSQLEMQLNQLSVTE